MAATGKSKKPTQKAVRAERALQNIPHPGLQFSYRHHVLIARAKQGELWALNQLSTEARSAVTPLLELVPPPPGTKEKVIPGKKTIPAKAQKPLTQHAKDVLKVIKSDWHTLPVFLDSRYLLVGGVPSFASAKLVFDTARELELTSIPVTSLKFSPEFQFEVRDAIAADKRGVAIRLSTADFKQLTLLDGYLAALLGVLKVTAEQTDILIDLEKQPDQFVAQQVGISTLANLPLLPSWRTVTLAAGCFPETIKDYKHDTWHAVERSDWLAWMQVILAQSKNRSRVPSYGDYGVRCGGEPLFIPNTPDPNIRYTTSENVLVRKGAKVDGKIKEICASLITKSEFSGADFSQGDAQIAEKAAKPGLPNNGAPAQCIQWCTNHHLELTASQIQELPVL
jgi:hypothetical protein